MFHLSTILGQQEVFHDMLLDQMKFYGLDAKADGKLNDDFCIILGF